MSRITAILVGLFLSFCALPLSAQGIGADLTLSGAITPAFISTQGIEATISLTIRNNGPDSSQQILVSTNLDLGPNAPFTLSPLPSTAPCTFIAAIQEPPQTSNPFMPGFAGVILASLSAGEAQTCSIGFRAPPDALGGGPLRFQVFGFLDSNAANNVAFLTLAFAPAALPIPSGGMFATVLLLLLISGLAIRFRSRIAV